MRSIDDHRERRLKSDANKDCLSVLVDIASERDLQVHQLLQAAAGEKKAHKTERQSQVTWQGDR